MNSEIYIRWLEMESEILHYDVVPTAEQKWLKEINHLTFYNSSTTAFAACGGDITGARPSFSVPISSHFSFWMGPLTIHISRHVVSNQKQFEPWGQMML